MYYQRKNESDLKLSDKVEILNLIKDSLSKRNIDLSQGGVINFFDRDGTINIKNEGLREAIQSAKGANVVAGTLTGKLPEELNDILKGFSFLGAAGGGMIYLPSLEKKIPFEIPQEKVKEIEKIYGEILTEYGVKDDLIQGIHLQYNSYEEDINQGMILLLSDDPIERQDYINRGTKEERLLEADPEERFEKKIVEVTAVEGGEHGKEILEKLYERIKGVEGIKMVPPGFFGDRTGKHTGADITALDKGDVFNIILEAYPDIIPHFMGNSTNDIPAIRAAWSRDDGIVSMVMPPNDEHDDTPLIAMLAYYAKKYDKNLVLVKPGPGEEFGTEYAKNILNDPKVIADNLESELNEANIQRYSDMFEELQLSGRMPQSIISAGEDLQKCFTASKKPVYTISDIESLIQDIPNSKVQETAHKLKRVAERKKELENNKTNDEREAI